MAEVTLKNNKQEIYDALKRAEEQLRELSSKKINPESEKEQRELEDVINSADKSLLEACVSPEILQKYKDVKSAVEAKQNELEELYGVEAVLQKIAVAHNAHQEFLHTISIEARQARSEHDNLLLKLSKDRNMELDERKIEEAQYKKELKLERDREASEYAYELSRKRKEEEDKWADEVAKREKGMREKEDALAQLVEDMDKRKDEIKALEDKVAEIPAIVAEAEEIAANKAKADSDKSHGFEVRQLKSQFEHEKQMLQMKAENFENENTELKKTIESLNEKLYSAYAEMRELASTVAANGGVKVLNSENMKK